MNLEELTAVLSGAETVRDVAMQELGKARMERDEARKDLAVVAAERDRLLAESAVEFPQLAGIKQALRDCHTQRRIQVEELDSECRELRFALRGTRDTLRRILELASQEVTSGS